MAEKETIQNKDVELTEWKRRLSLILKYSAKISAAESLADILNLIADETKEILRADRCSVFLLDSEKKELYTWVSHGVDTKLIRFSADRGLAGASAITGETLNISDAYSDSRFNPEFDRKTGYRTRTMLCMPLVNQPGDIIGVFQILNKEGGSFTGQDEEILGLLSQHAAGAIEKAGLYDEITKSFASFINTLAEAIDARDPMTSGHSTRVCLYALLIAGKMGYSQSEKEVLRYAALLHDLGKIGVKEAVLTKEGSLNADEYIHIRTHAFVTKKILERTYFRPNFREIPRIASSHHENFDGSGYPEGLSGEDIPEISRILAVADVFDAITYKRHYRDPMAFDRVIEFIKEETGKKFDPRCVGGFLGLKIYEVLKIMTEVTDNEIPETSRDIFGEMTIGDLFERYPEESCRAIKEFNRFYPVGNFTNVS